MVKHLERIMEDKSNKCLIFVGTKRTADDITRVRFLITAVYVIFADRYHSSFDKTAGHRLLFTVIKLRMNVTGS